MDLLSANTLLTEVGPYAAAVMFLVLLVESALPIGFVLPGDTLLLTAGLSCAAGHFSLLSILPAAAAGSVLGAQGGYLLGRAASARTSPLPGLRSARVRRALARFGQMADRRGFGLALVAARFIPVARSIAAPVSGLARMSSARFTVWQVTGGLAWTTSVTLIGYAAGRLAPGLERYLPVFLLTAALSFPITGGFGYLLVRLRARRLLARSPISTSRTFDKETANR